MSVDPREAQAFASMLGKLDGVQKGTETVDVTAGQQQRMADNDMTSILSAFAKTSGTESALALRPEQLTEEKTALQKPGDAIGAEFKPEEISPVLGEPEKDHPMRGKLVGEAEEEIEVPTEDGITMQDIRLLAGEGKLSTETMQKAIEIIRKQRKDKVKETVTTEDSLSDIKKRLSDYLQDIKTAAPVDDRELSKKNDPDTLGPAIKTITTADGKKIKIHGNEDDGFRLKINDRVHSAQFRSFDEAQMACETYVAKRKRATEDQDYVEEK